MWNGFLVLIFILAVIMSLSVHMIRECVGLTWILAQGPTNHSGKRQTTAFSLYTIANAFFLPHQISQQGSSSGLISQAIPSFCFLIWWWHYSNFLWYGLQRFAAKSLDCTCQNLTRPRNQGWTRCIEHRIPSHTALDLLYWFRRYL